MATNFKQSNLAVSKANILECDIDSLNVNNLQVTNNLNIENNGTIVLKPSGGDDSVQINAAYTTLSARGGGTVQLLEGTFVLNNPIIPQNYINIKGCGRLTTIFLNTAAVGFLITDVATSKVKFEDFTIQGPPYPEPLPPYTPNGKIGFKIWGTIPSGVTNGFTMNNILFVYLDEGIGSDDAGGVIGPFDCLYFHCEFIQCNTAIRVTGTGTEIIDIVCRACTTGILLSPTTVGVFGSGFYMSHSVFSNCQTDISVVNDSRCIGYVCDSCWFEVFTFVHAFLGYANKTYASYHNCLFQPAASSFSQLTSLEVGWNGQVSFLGCDIYDDAKPGQDFPSLSYYNATANNGSLTVLNCTRLAGGSWLTSPSLMLTKNSPVTFNQLNITTAGAPAAPVDGDIWFDGAAINVRIAGVTRTINVT